MPLVSVRFAFLAAPALSAAARAEAPPGATPDRDSRPARTFVDGDAVHCSGSRAARLLRTLEHAQATMSRPLIASRGGDARVAIAGEAVHARGPAVAGRGSGCANDPFVPAPGKAIAPRDLVMLHDACPVAYRARDTRVPATRGCMRLLNRLPALFLLACCVLGAARAGEPSPDLEALWNASPATMFIEGDTLHYYGELREVDVAPLGRLLAQAPAGLSRLRIASPGGDSLASIAIGRMIQARALEIVVVGRGCGSGCANYVFTPAGKKTISPGSIVMWHYSCPSSMPGSRRAIRRQLASSFGTPNFTFSSEDNGVPVTDPTELRRHFDARLDELVDTTHGFIAAYRAGHRDIYAGTGVDDRIICLADHMKLPDPPRDMAGYGYTLSVADMERFGVCGVSAPPDYIERTGALIRADPALGAGFGVVRLADHPRFRPRHAPGHCARQATLTH